MSDTQLSKKDPGEQGYYLSELLNIPVILQDHTIGKLDDFVIVDKDKFAEVTHLRITRPFGRPPFTIPWEKVKSFTNKKLVIDTTDNLEQYVGALPSSAVLLADHILDKKVLDTEGREVEVVYDVKMTLRNNKIYVTDVDLSRYGLLRRMGLKWLATLVHSLPKKSQSHIVPWSYVEPLPEEINSFEGYLKLKFLREEFSEIPPVDLADILEALDHEQRVAIFTDLDTPHASDTLEELEPKVQRDLIASLKKDKVAGLINEMTPGQAADLLAVLPWWDVDAIIQLLDKENVSKIHAILEKQEEKIVNLAASNYLKFPPEKTVITAVQEFPMAAKGKASVMYIYVLDPEDRLLGVLNLKELLVADGESLLKDIMTTKVISLSPESTLKDAYKMFSRYNFRAVPIADDSGKMLGILLYRDVVNLRHRFIE